MAEKDYNKLSRTVKGQAFTSAWLKKKAPLVYLYGPSGAGKTYALGTLLDHAIEDGTRPYAPVLYIDGDGGSETVGDRAENEELCTLQEYDGPYDAMLPWFFDRLEQAETAKCGAIIIEGASALFASMLTPAVIQLTRADGEELWGAHKEPSGRIATFFEAIKKLKVNRCFRGIGVPIFVSLNTRQVNGVHFPDFSENVRDKAMRTADAFVELCRESSTQFLCKATPDNVYRKLRREAVANRLEAAWDIELPGMLTLWAIEAARSRKKLDKSMAALVESAAEAVPVPEPQTEESTSQ